MRFRTGLPALLGLGLSLWGGLTAGAQPGATTVAIAAAGDLRGALEELKGAFEARNPRVQLQLTFGASGSLTAQIQQGAPFEVFLAADTGFPERLVTAGLAGPEGLFPYATGCLTLWVRKDLGVDPGKDGLRTLLNPALKKIATANPQVAPYGRAGEAALRQAGLYDRVQHRLVFADNIAQAAQFLQAGTAEAGLISCSQANNPVLRGSGLAWAVPAKGHPPLRQAGVILKATLHPEQARAFVSFLTGAEGQTILGRHGFGKP
jgi:molybdate transport system substrate-binding protein